MRAIQKIRFRLMTIGLTLDNAILRATLDYEKDPDPKHWRTINGARVHLDNNGNYDGGANGKFNGAHHWGGPDWKQKGQAVSAITTMLSKLAGNKAKNSASTKNVASQATTKQEENGIINLSKEEMIQELQSQRIWVNFSTIDSQVQESAISELYAVVKEHSELADFAKKYNFQVKEGDLPTYRSGLSSYYSDTFGLSNYGNGFTITLNKDEFQYADTEKNLMDRETRNNWHMPCSEKDACTIPCRMN